MRRGLGAVLIVAALAGGAGALMAPPRVASAPGVALPLTWPVARGAFHVHSQRSDGTGSVDEIAAAAARAGLQFVVLTDHGDGTRRPDAPSYRSGVLCLDGVEISTTRGHYVVIGMPQAPYPLAGDPRAVVDDVRRLGGFGYVAHPGSPKPDLRWEDDSVWFDALEWLNADSEWRDEPVLSLARALLTYPWRPVETLGALLDRPHDVIARWDRLTSSRRVPVVAGADAHARVGFRQMHDPYEDRVIARLPAYEVSFRVFVNHVVLDGPLTGDAAHDARLIVGALREGRVFTFVDALARSGSFEAKAVSGGAVARPGEYLELRGPAAIEARIAAPAGTTLRLLRDGEVVYETQEPALRVDVGETSGAYRIEAQLPGTLARSSIPWLLSNPFYIGLRESHARARVRAAAVPATHRTPVATAMWRAEASPGSFSALRATTTGGGTPAIAWDFTLAEGAAEGQYAAVQFPAGSVLAAHDRLQLRTASSPPRRLWVQLRAPGPDGGERWGQTFYVGESLEPIELRFADFAPVGEASSPSPPLERVDSVLLVVDTLNTRPGTSGTLLITDLWLAR